MTTFSNTGQVRCVKAVKFIFIPCVELDRSRHANLSMSMLTGKGGLPNPTITHTDTVHDIGWSFHSRDDTSISFLLSMDRFMQYFSLIDYCLYKIMICRLRNTFSIKKL